MARALVKTHASSSIGSVKESMLTEVQFQAEHGAGWVLMDGRDVTGSDYNTITGNTTIPDARGQFLRGKNNGRADGNEDPTGERALGNFENDKMQDHGHGTPNIFEPAGGGNAYGEAAGTSSTVTKNSNGATVTIGGSGSPRTGSETAPKNLAVNIFIKINN